ncbi:protein sidekick-1-like [Babylonia areolata]|uniref:protein sidekick-1-like n=1 Tax=Babylonia areolata TaxID=304850 RepID=UPI003FD04160
MAWTAVLVLSCLVQFVVSENPEFLTNKPQVVAVKGDTAIIPCRIRNIGVHKVLWSFERVLLTFDTRRISDDTRISVERPYETEWNLHIKNVTPEDEGTYLCQLNTNPMMSYHIKLLVLNEPPSPVMPREVVTLSGSDAEITCKLPNLNDIGTWSYQANNEARKSSIIENNKFSFREGQGQDSHVHTLIISDVRARDEGVYHCRARSGIEAKTFLRVVVPPPPPSLEAKAESPNKLMVRWRKPSARNTEVAGYVLYVHNHLTGKEHVFEVPTGKDLDGEESFRVGDLSTGTTYTIQLATKLQMGDKASLGKRSPEVNITTPLFIPQAPGWVKVKRLSDEEAEVVWAPPPPSKTEGIIRGYEVFYVPLKGKKKPIPSKEKSVRVEKPEGNKWKARLTGLKPKTRYHVRVGGFTHKGTGRLSKTVPYLHKALPPELSLNGRVLSDNSVLLTINTLGSAKMTNVKMFYTEARQPSWRRLDFSPKWKFTVVGGLEPHTSYFFKVKAKVGGKLKQCVTHITTPPHNLQAPQNVQVSATASTSIEVKWDYVIAGNMSSLPLGYKVILEEMTEQDEGEKRSRHSVVFNRTTVEIKDLKPGTKYNIQVCAFNGFGEGPRTDGLLFHIAESDIKQDAVNEPIPPRFVHELPERLTIQRGEPVKITCVAEGYPVPDVQWYSNKEPIGVSAQGSNQLYMANIVSDTVLACRATSPLGEIEATTVIELSRGEADDALGLTLRPENVQVTTLTLAWTVKGDPRAVDRFEVVISDKSDRALLSRTLPGQTRSFNLRSLQPETEYRAVLKAFGPSSSSGAQPVAEAKTSAVTLRMDGSDPAPASTAAPPGPTPPRYKGDITLSVMDVTPKSASVEWGFSGLDPRRVQLFELKVKSRSNYTMLTETLQPHLNIMQLSLQPGQTYFVQVRAFDRRGEVLALSTIQVVTPKQSAVTSTPSPVPDSDGPVLKRASLNLTSHAVTGDSARLDWSLSGAQQADIGQYILRVKDGEDRTLLRQEMTREARSLTLSNLTPRTRYVVELQALDDKKAVVTSTESSFTTTTASSAQDSNPDPTKLHVFTEELNKSSVKIAWTTPPKLLPNLSGVSLRLTDIANVTLLTQQMSPLTRSLTVRNLQAGELYQAFVELKGAQGGRVVRRGYLKFETEPTRGMPGRPLILSSTSINSTAVSLRWRNSRSPSPAPGSEDITGYVVNFLRVDGSNKPLGGTYQLPVFGSDQFVVIPNLSGGQRYLFQVAARNQYSFGPLSEPVVADLPPQ